MIKEFEGIKPSIDDTAFVAESADIIGSVTIEKNANIWYNAVLRGDSNKIVVGENSNVQDGTIVHCGEKNPTIIVPIKESPTKSQVTLGSCNTRIIVKNADINPPIEKCSTLSTPTLLTNSLIFIS